MVRRRIFFYFLVQLWVIKAFAQTVIVTPTPEFSVVDGKTGTIARDEFAGGLDNLSGYFQQVPTLVIDVIGKTSSDRVCIFNNAKATHGFDSEWDRKIIEKDGITQLYVNASDKSKLRVATVPDLNNISLGFIPERDGNYTLKFSLSEQLISAEIYLHDEVTKTKEPIRNGSSYSFDAKKGQSPPRFSLRYGTPASKISTYEELIDVKAVAEDKIRVTNRSSKDCSVFISGKGAPRQKIEVKAGGEVTIDSLSRGTYIIHLQNAVVADVRRVIIK